MESLCRSCSHLRKVVSGTGSEFLLCQISQVNKAYAKYPPQPVVRCAEYAQGAAGSELTLTVLTPAFSICRLDPDGPDPRAWAGGEFVSITQTREEISVVCDANSVPENVKSEPNWRGIRIVGPLDFDLVGVVAAITAALAAKGISVFVVSTFDTDYFFVRAFDLEAAIVCLRSSGYEVVRPSNGLEGDV